jgi:uncharacterized SAM-binding protein YcdF (DUF218 family)
MADVLPKVLGILLTPPGIVIVVALLGFLIQLKWVWLGNAVIALALAALLMLSLPITGKNLLAGLEKGVKPLPAVVPEDIARKAGAIVVLGGGRYTSAPEYGADIVNRYTLERLRYAARLHRQTGLPVLVSGGSPFGEETSEAALMKSVLEREFNVPVKWVEERSPDTLGNATASKAILAEAQIRTVLLVTHAWHMPRAEWAFVHAGLIAIPAPTLFTKLSVAERRLLGYLPSGRGLYLSSLALHEHLGLRWYKSKYEVQTIVPLPRTEPKPAPAN